MYNVICNICNVSVRNGKYLLCDLSANDKYLLCDLSAQWQVLTL